MIPASIVLSAIRPRFNAIAFRFAVGPLAGVNLTVGELALAREELRFVPFTLK